MGEYTTKTTDADGNDAWESTDGRMFKTRGARTKPLSGSRRSRAPRAPRRGIRRRRWLQLIPLPRKRSRNLTRSNPIGRTSCGVTGMTPVRSSQPH